MTLRCTVALFVPADRPERFHKAVSSGADVAILDLEDAVAPANKDVARRHVAEALASGLDAWVRINPTHTELGRLDLDALRSRPPRGVVIPKAASQTDVTEVRKTVGGTALVALIESIEGLRNIDAIAACADALAFGGFDLCAELGARPVPEVLAPLRSRIILAARHAAVAAIDTPFISLDDDAGLVADTRRAVDFGFDGKLAIHPKQVARIHATFAPDPREYEHARAVVALAAAGGVATVDGKMIDAPLIRAAQRVLDRAERVSTAASGDERG